MPYPHMFVHTYTYIFDVSVERYNSKRKFQSANLELVYTC